MEINVLQKCYRVSSGTVANSITITYSSTSSSFISSEPSMSCCQSLLKSTFLLPEVLEKQIVIIFTYCVSVDFTAPDDRFGIQSHQ